MIRCLVVAMALAVLLVGCGGGEAPPAPQPTTAPAPEAAEAMESPALPEIDFVADSLPADSTAPSSETGRPATAAPDLDALRAAVEAAPGDVEVRRRLATALRLAGHKEEAVVHFEQVLERDPSARSLFHLAAAYTEASRLREAEAAYRRLLQSSPGNPQALHNLANVAVRRGARDEAIGLYRQAIEADPRYLLAYVNLARTLESLGNHEAAYGAYLTALEITPANPREQGIYNDAVYRLAALAMALGDPGQAEQLLSQLLGAYPGHPEAHYARAQALLRLGRPDEAGRELETHMRLLAARKPTAAAATQP